LEIRSSKVIVKTFKMSSSTESVWADTPFKLIKSPFGSKDLRPSKAHGSQYIAQQMVHLHNCILRLLNSIYNQAVYVKSEEDIRDFLAYIKHWHDELHHHHSVEEDFFFPRIETLTGVPGVMEGNVEQHNAFEPGLKALGDYATSTSIEDYNGKKVQSIIDDFGHILSTHLADEIPTLLALEKYDDKAIRKLWSDTFAYVLKTCDFVSAVDSCLHTMVKLTNVSVRPTAHANVFMGCNVGGWQVWRPGIPSSAVLCSAVLVLAQA
jgi:hemerythrin-like domain-containing protein